MAWTGCRRPPTWLAARSRVRCRGSIRGLRSSPAGARSGAGGCRRLGLVRTLLGSRSRIRRSPESPCVPPGTPGAGSVGRGGAR